MSIGIHSDGSLSSNAMSSIGGSGATVGNQRSQQFSRSIGGIIQLLQQLLPLVQQLIERLQADLDHGRYGQEQGRNGAAPVRGCGIGPAKSSSHTLCRDNTERYHDRCDAQIEMPANVTQADNGKTLVITAGSRFTVTLPGNPTTGSSWTIDNLDTNLLRRVGDYVFTPSNPNLLGSPGEFKFTFEGVDAGTTDLRLDYRQSFDPDTAPAETFAVRVNIS